MFNWYVVQTKPQKEDVVCKQLNMAGLETLNPKVKTLSRGYRPLFPNYIFLRWNLKEAHNYHLVKYTRGVNKVLGTPEYPVPLDDSVIHVIKERLNSTEVLEQNTMRVGRKVKVKRGLLQDLIGVLDKPVSADGRVQVLLKIHERQMKAMISCKDIALVA